MVKKIVKFVLVASILFSYLAINNGANLRAEEALTQDETVSNEVEVENNEVEEEQTESDVQVEETVPTVEPTESIQVETTQQKFISNSQSAENSKSNEGYVESEILNYVFDENAKMYSAVEDTMVDSKDSAPRAAIAYGHGYLDFIGKSSQVLTVYNAASGGIGYTYFNTGSGERVATLGQSGNRIKIVIGGYEGWIDKTSYVTSTKWIPIASVPNNFSEYYTVNSAGDLIYTYGYYESTTSIVIGKTPSFMSSGTKYYSLDGIYYYTNRTTLFQDKGAGSTSNAINKTSPFYNYYQYLPFRSTTNLTAKDFQSYLQSSLSSDRLQTSVLNNTTNLNQFFKAESSYGVNAALEYSMALLESGYGTSQIAREKNNLFGWGAVDSGPYAGAYKFSSVASGIDYHAKNAVSAGFLDAYEDSRYFGGNVGNKNNGLNVKYASDPYWGMKIAGIYYSMDKKAGFKDYNYYKLAIQNKGVGSGAYINGKASYYLYNRLSRIYVTNMPFVLVGESTNQYTIMSDIPVCNTGDAIYNYTINQSTLNVEKRYYNCNPNGVHFAADYKFNTDTVNVYKPSFNFAGGSTIRQPGGNTPIVSDDMQYVMNSDGVTIKYAYKKDSNNKITTYYEYYSGTTIANAKSNVKFVFNMNTKNDTIINAHLEKDGKILKYYEYFSNTKYGGHGARIRYVFNMNGEFIKNVYGYTDGKLSKIFEYEKGTKYGNHGPYITVYYMVNTNTGYIYKSVLYNRGKITGYTEYYENTTYGLRNSKQRYRYYVDNKGYVTHGTQFGTTGKEIRHYEYHPNAIYGLHGPKIKFMFYVSEKTGELEVAYALNSNWKRTRMYKYQRGTKYDRNGSHGNKIVLSQGL